MRFLITLIAATALAALANGQTTINGSRQIRGVWDASGAASSKPARTGAGLPATCEVGEQYFRTDTAPGQNLHLCTAPDTWTAISGSGAGASTASQLADFVVTRASATQLAVNAAGAVRFGSRTCAAPAVPATLSISPGAGVSGTARLYVRADCALVWALDFTDNSSLQCNTNCMAGAGTEFPADSVPLYEWNATADAWAAAGTDRRAFISTKAAKAMPSGGIVIAQDADGADLFSVDGATVIMAGAASVAPAADKLPRASASGTIEAGWVPAMTGDSGAGGAAGLAPAPAAGDAAASKYLKADGTWAVPSGETTAIVPVTFSTSSPVAVNKGGFYFNNSDGTMTFDLPAITTDTVGNQICFRNYTAKTGAIILQLPAATSIDVDGANGSAAGTLVSAGAAGDAVCAVAVAVGQYMGYVSSGTWTNN